MRRAEGVAGQLAGVAWRELRLNGPQFGPQRGKEDHAYHESQALCSSTSP